MMIAPNVRRLRLTLVLAVCFWGCSGDRLSPEATEVLSGLETRYGIQVELAPVFPVRNPHGVIDGRLADSEPSSQYAVVLGAEMGRYPVALVRRTGLRTLVLCEGLSFAGQLRAAVPDFGRNTLYLDVDRGDEAYRRRVFHHEFFHIVDFRDDGSLYRDERWTGLNPPGFQYGDGGHLVQDQPQTSVLTDAYPGFLNHYSTTGVEEDKAEVFTILITDHAYLKRRTATDPVLEAKVGMLKQGLQRFCPAMDAAYWAR